MSRCCCGNEATVTSHSGYYYSKLDAAENILRKAADEQVNLASTEARKRLAEQLITELIFRR